MSRSKPNPRRDGEPASRNWTAARAKVVSEGRCRRCFATQGLEAAHVVPRSRVRPGVGDSALNIVPLCNGCHRGQHEGRWPLWPLLRDEERAYAAELVGEGEAERRLRWWQ